MSRRHAQAGIRPEVWAARDSLIATRRDFHRYPELSWRETRTQSVILERLRLLDLQDVRTIGRTGATAVVRGARGGPALLWRADIDALPIPERSGLAFTSTNDGVMHACGHDTHIALALELAALIAGRRDHLRGDVRFVFQPAEEDAGGADACLADGILDDPRIDRVLGFHVSADLPIGAINVAPGPFFAAPTAFEATIIGKGGHAAAPHQSIDAVVVAAHVVTALQTVVSRSLAPADSAVLTIGTISGGFRWNVIAESATLTGTVRSYTDRVRDQMITRAEEIIAGVCSAFGADYTFAHSTSCPPLVNDVEVASFVASEGCGFFGEGNVHAVPSFGADDMAVFLQERPGCYYWLGARNEAKGIAGRHHDPGFMIDEDALVPGLEFAMRLVEGSLEELSQR